MRHTIDRIFLVIVSVLTIGGFLIFFSASLGLLSRTGAGFSSVAFNQILFGLIGGTSALFIAANIHYRIWRKYAFYIMLVALALMTLVFVPHIGFSHGGASRWIAFGQFSFQPSEFLKIAFIIYLATWLSGMQKHITTFSRGILPLGVIVSIVGVLLLMQPDTDTFLIMTVAAGAMFLATGGRLRDIMLVGLVGIVALSVLVFMRPYLMERFTTFMHPSIDPQGSGWQIRQSLIAVGSGGLWGRGFGQSIQKFEYLPEPISDSVFAVYAEEFGFAGTLLLVVVFVFFAMRGFRIATLAPDLFGLLLVVGFITLIVAQAFLNIAAMLSLAPLSGLPLPFISHGGTALLATLASIGIILNVSRYRKTTS